jgi:hypothetical protein
MSQLIPDIEDREFTTGPGHWTGDFEWVAEMYPGGGPALSVEITTETKEAIIRLDYPNIKAFLNKVHTLFINIFCNNQTGGNIFCDATLILAGHQYEFTGLQAGSGGFVNDLYATLGNAGDPTDTSLEIHVYSLEAEDPTGTWQFYGVAGYVPAGMQYLPLVGIG